MKEFSSNYLLFLNQVALDFAVQYVTCLHISLPCLHSPAACLLLLLLTSPGFPCLPPSPPPFSLPSHTSILPSPCHLPTSYIPYSRHPPIPLPPIVYFPRLPPSLLCLPDSLHCLPPFPPPCLHSYRYITAPTASPFLLYFKNAPVSFPLVHPPYPCPAGAYLHTSGSRSS